MQPDCGWIAKRSLTVQRMRTDQMSDGLPPCMDMVQRHLQGGSSLSGKTFLSTWACHGNSGIGTSRTFMQSLVLRPQRVQSEPSATKILL